MPDFADIRRGLAGNLAAIADTQVSAYMLDNPSPGMLQVAGLDEIEYDRTFGRDDTLFVVIEGCASLAAGDIGSQKNFDRWLASSGAGSVKAAVESDKRLTKRLQQDGTVQTDQPAVADDLRVTRFRGYGRRRLENGTVVLLGEWIVQVETSG